MIEQLPIISDKDTSINILSRLIAIELKTECCHECAAEKAVKKYKELFESLNETFAESE